MENKINKNEKHHKNIKRKAEKHDAVNRIISTVVLADSNICNMTQDK